MLDQRARRSVAGAVLAITVMAALVAAAPVAYAVAGGAPVADGSFGFAAKIEVGEVRSCSGALVAPRWVITAASCFPQPLAGTPAPPATAIIGRTDLSGTGGQT